jgi:hypothetical protein
MNVGLLLVSTGILLFATVIHFFRLRFSNQLESRLEPEAEQDPAPIEERKSLLVQTMKKVGWIWLVSGILFVASQFSA